MPDEAPRQQRGEGTRERPPGASVPERQHPSGWRVQPAPDGRGAPPPDKPRSPFSGIGRRWLIIVLVLLGINFWISSLIPNGHDRIRVPYNPTFIQQIERGNVKEISSKGATVQGQFQHEFKYPPTGDDAKV